MTGSKVYSDQRNWSDTYLTDPRLIELLGPFDLDPCCPEGMPWQTAAYMFTLEENGLQQDWTGNRVFMNPPYRGVMKWAEKFSNEALAGIALLNGRSSETKATQLIMHHSKAIWFPKGRLTFYNIEGNPYSQKWFSSLLIGLNQTDVKYLMKAKEVYGGEIFYK